MDVTHRIDPTDSLVVNRECTTTQWILTVGERLVSDGALALHTLIVSSQFQLPTLSLHGREKDNFCAIS